MATKYGTNNNDWINGTRDADTIYGFLGEDFIFAGADDDVIKGGGGADHIDGGSGIDTTTYADSSEGVIVSLATGNGYNGTAEGDTFSGIENITGSNHEDILQGDTAANILRGLDGDDSLKGGGGADVLYGDAGDDTLVGGSGADILFGGAGRDTASYFDSAAGVSVSLIGNTGTNGDAEGDSFIDIENLHGSQFDDVLIGDDTVNILTGDDGADTLKGLGGDDYLVGGMGNDFLYGGDGNDYLETGLGIDYLFGGPGDDTYYYTNLQNFITEYAGEGNDTLIYAAGYGGAALPANVENLIVLEETHYALGNELDNQILAFGGDNTIDGGGGVDWLWGGGGNDEFIFHAGEADGDTVQFFDGNGAGPGDTIVFRGYGLGTFEQIGADQWMVTSIDGVYQETITFAGTDTIHPTDYLFDL